MDSMAEKYGMAFRELGCGPAILLYHDCASGGELPEEDLRLIADAGYRVILIQLSAHEGDSAKSPDPASIAKETIPLLNRLGIGRVVVFGIGQGGAAVLELARSFPKRVAAYRLMVETAWIEHFRRIADGTGIKAPLA